MRLKEVLIRERRKYVALIEECELRVECLSRYKDFRLDLIGSGKYPQARLFKKSEKKGRYAGKKDIEHILGIIEYNVRLEVIKNAKEDIEALDKMIASVKPVDINEIDLPKVYKLFMPNSISKYATRIEKWKRDAKKLKEQYPNKYTENNTIRLKNGTYVKSKSEAIIGNELIDLNAVFEYELPKILNNGKIIWPDFTIYDPVEDKEYIWEHLGYSDRMNYLADFALKAKGLHELGFTIGDNLIMSSDSIDQSINSEMISRIIEVYFGTLGTYL